MAGHRAADQTAVRDVVLQTVSAGQRNLAKLIQDEFKVSRATAHNYLQSMIEAGDITRLRPGSYALAHTENQYFHQIDGLHEDQVWRNEIFPNLSDLPKNVREIWEYGCTEMINNAIDHSESEGVTITVDRTALKTKVDVYDTGVGIFRKIAEALGLEEDRHAVLELAKGKVTTDPDNHTGEGIFFSSRTFDEYVIHSEGVMFHLDDKDDLDWVLGDEHRREDGLGTSVTMRLANDSTKSLTSIFDEYATDDEDYGFSRTVVPVKLLAYGDDRLVSRSQARRLLSRFDRFKMVVLNFDQVESIGQAFADEVFRVFATRHPEIELVGVRANEQVTRMINRAKSD